MQNITEEKGKLINWIAPILAGFVIRLLWLGHKSLWLDEANSLRLAQFGQTAFWAGLADWYHPPLYFWFLEKWLLWGDSPLWVRLPSAFFGTIMIGLAYYFARQVYPKSASLTAWFVALSPLLVWYSQETRHYTQLACLALIALIATTHTTTRRPIGWFIVGTFCTIVALYWHYFAVFILLLQMILLAWLRVEKKAHNTALLLCGLQWLISFLAFIPWLRSEAVAETTRQLIDPANPTYIAKIWQLFNPAFLIGVGLVLIPIVFCAALFLFQWAQPRQLLRSRPMALLLLLGFALSLIVFVLPRAYSLKRHLVMFAPVGLLVLAWVWTDHKRMAQTALGLSLVASLCSLFLVPKTDWQAAAAYLDTVAQAGDQIWIAPYYMEIPFDYYKQTPVPSGGVLLGAGGLDNLQFIEHGNDIPLTGETQPERVWLIEQGSDFDPQHMLLGWLQKKGSMKESETFYNLTVRLFDVD